MTLVNTDSSCEIGMFPHSVRCGESARLRGLEVGEDAWGEYVGNQYEYMSWLRWRQVWAIALQCGSDAGSNSRNGRRVDAREWTKRERDDCLSCEDWLREDPVWQRFCRTAGGKSEFSG